MTPFYLARLIDDPITNSVVFEGGTVADARYALLRAHGAPGLAGLFGADKMAIEISGPYEVRNPVEAQVLVREPTHNHALAEPFAYDAAIEADDRLKR